MRTYLDSDKIQVSLYHDCIKKTHKMYVPNVFAFEWESDFLSVTRAAFVHEYEIKISRSDFRLDLKKHRHDVLTSKAECERPNFFWYVAPENIIPIREVPKHAGLMIANGRNLRIVKKAPSLHREKITRKLAVKILTSYQYKYWNLRLGKKA